MSDLLKTNWLERAKHDAVANMYFKEYVFQRDYVQPRSTVTIGTGKTNGNPFSTQQKRFSTTKNKTKQKQ